MNNLELQELTTEESLEINGGSIKAVGALSGAIAVGLDVISAGARKKGNTTLADYLDCASCISKTVYTVCVVIPLI